MYIYGLKQKILKQLRHTDRVPYALRICTEYEYSSSNNWREAKYVECGQSRALDRVLRVRLAFQREH
jgi:hypothetical protein